jgi:hypothetical protein
VRNHSIEDANRKRFRYVTLVVDVAFAKQRTFNARGEVDHQLSLSLSLSPTPIATMDVTTQRRVVGGSQPT